MRYIFIVLFLVSFGSVSFGDDSDFFYCTVEEFAGINASPMEYKKFKFKVGSKSIIFKTPSGSKPIDIADWEIIDYKKKMKNYKFSPKMKLNITIQQTLNY